MQINKELFCFRFYSNRNRKPARERQRNKKRAGNKLLTNKIQYKKALYNINIEGLVVT